MAEEYLKEVQLPSRGIFYSGQVPDGWVSVEPMGTREEKLYASSQSGGIRIIDKIFDSCVTCPISHNELVLGDRLYLLLQLRSVSYGDEYEFPFRCRECNAKCYEIIKLSEIPIRAADNGQQPTFQVKLPILGVELELRLLTGIDEDKVRRYVGQLNARTRGKSDPIEYIYRLARRIVSIDNQSVGIKEAMELVESIKGKDSLALRDEIDDHDVGPELEVEPMCTSCGFVNGPLVMPFDSEFFRPRRRRTKTTDHLAAAEALDHPRED